MTSTTRGGRARSPMGEEVSLDVVEACLGACALIPLSALKVTF